MEYLPGIHEKLQGINYFLILCDFNIPLYENRFDVDDTYQSTNTLKGDGGEILSIRWFKPTTSQTVYSYIVGYYKDDIYHEIGKESPLSRDFICINTTIFEDITKSFNREIKIDKILEDETNWNC